MEQTSTTADADFAHRLADGAGALLLRLRDEMGFDDPAALRAAGDKLSHEYIVDTLAGWYPQDAVRSEEGPRDVPDRVGASRVWIVDPLDGTREFAEAGRVDWAVHVALWSAGRLSVGVVALPGQRLVLGTRDRVERPDTGGDRPRMVVSRTRAPETVGVVAERLGARLIPMGSAGAKIAAVVTGAADVYVHAGGQYEWDSAAPVAVALAAGLHASRLDGSPLTYNQPDPWLPDLMVCRADLAPAVLDAVREMR